MAIGYHPFWVADQHRWLDATQLRPGMWLRTSSGTYVQVTAVHAFTRTNQTVHNLTIETTHTYYVLAGTTPVLVHNCDRSGLDFTDAERQKVYDANAEKNGGVYKCDYCGRTVERRPSVVDRDGVAQKGLPDDAQIDHVDPKATGGCGAAHNGCVACRVCNRSKSTKPLDVWDNELRDFLDEEEW